MAVPSQQLSFSDPQAVVQVRVQGPDGNPLASRDLQRLFQGQTLTPARRKHLAHFARIVALCGNGVVGVAAYERADEELRVHEFGLDTGSACGAADIAGALLDALELACLAGGGRRIILTPRASIAGPVLRMRGYTTISEGCAGAWHQKTLPS